MNTIQQDVANVEWDEHVLLPNYLRESAQFILNSRAENEKAWGQFRGGTLTFYHTSLCVEALVRFQVNDFLGPIAEALAVTKRLYDKSPALTIENIVHLIRIQSVDAKSDEDFLASLRRRLCDKLSKKFGNSEKLPTRLLSECISVLAVAKEPILECLNRCLQELLEGENRGEGSWLATKDAQPSHAATAYAVLALFASATDDHLKAARRGVRYLENVIQNSGWESVGTGGDVFTQALVLRALARTGTEAVVQQGVAILKSTRNCDCGWGGVLDDPSSIETSAMVLKALLSCGEHKFVLSRAAHSSVRQILQRADTLERELANLKHEFEERLLRQSSEVVMERNSLRDELTALKKEFEIRVSNQVVGIVAQRDVLRQEVEVLRKDLAAAKRTADSYLMQNREFLSLSGANYGLPFSEGLMYANTVALRFYRIAYIADIISTGLISVSQECLFVFMKRGGISAYSRCLADRR